MAPPSGRDNLVGETGLRESADTKSTPECWRPRNSALWWIHCLSPLGWCSLFQVQEPQFGHSKQSPPACLSILFFFLQLIFHSLNTYWILTTCQAPCWSHRWPYNGGRIECGRGRCERWVWARSLESARAEPRTLGFVPREMKMPRHHPRASSLHSKLQLLPPCTKLPPCLAWDHATDTLWMPTPPTSPPFPTYLIPLFFRGIVHVPHDAMYL